MTKIVFLEQFRQKVGSQQDSLTDILKKISADLDLFKSEKPILTISDLKSFFEKRINSALFERKEIASEKFLCSSYVSDLLANLKHKVPESWYLIDYILEVARKNTQLSIRASADFCFILCSLFPERGNHRLMKLEFYSKTGPSLYYYFFQKTGKLIGRYMGDNFTLMAEVVSENFSN